MNTYQINTQEQLNIQEHEMLKERLHYKEERLLQQKRIKILILDDSKRVGSALQRQLRSMGHEAYSVMNEEAVLEQLATTPFDCVVCDLVLEADQSGVVTLEKIKTAYPSVRRVLMSAFVSNADLSYAKDAKICDASFQKPWSTSTLRSALGI